MAYCGSDQYGDYEHGAYYYDLETEAVKSLRAAKVVFLGDSRTQIGFSTDPVQAYFKERAIPYYIAGFGYAETVDFEQLLVERYKIKPDVLIINSDPFFICRRWLPSLRPSRWGGRLLRRFPFRRGTRGCRSRPRRRR